ncbi:hypothetical protein SAMN02745134_00270 [Clostridium acidisoli DSM 12555]|uniref:Uncharacterized protein n=1 Tax=Clostridium acidisoli DSM 12555 TaxID=1121291 RepID=A0A1W1X048_9CLOT|nr:hypothetical protein [Clostridium acidisoli]SMC17257.1 hypothetical protein SAMN02745134_00270 [Clostridium acidisoli DSM 12555]
MEWNELTYDEEVKYLDKKVLEIKENYKKMYEFAKNGDKVTEKQLELMKDNAFIILGEIERDIDGLIAELKKSSKHE